MKPNCSGFVKKKLPHQGLFPHPYQSRRLRSPPCQPHSLHRSPGKHTAAKWLAPWVSLETSKNPNTETTYQHQTKKQAKIQNETFTSLSPTFSDFSFTEPVLEDCSVASRPAAPAAQFNLARPAPSFHVGPWSESPTAGVSSSPASTNTSVPWQIGPKLILVTGVSSPNLNPNQYRFLCSWLVTSDDFYWLSWKF